MMSAQRARALGAGAALTLTSLGAAACGSSPGAGAAETVSVVASTNVYGDIARQIGGDRVKVTSFISDPAQDPHSFEAGTRTRLAMSKAGVVIENGGGYDDFMDTLLKGSGSKARVLNAVQISGKTAPAGEELNEHVWYDLPSVARLADRISAALAEASPEDARTFSANAASFKARLKTLEGRVAAVKAAHSGEGVAVTEPVPGHLLAAAGLVDRTPEEFAEAVEEGDDVPPRALRDTLALLTGRKVRALVVNVQTSGPQTGRVREAAGEADVPVVPVAETLPAGRDYVAWMDGTIAALQKALS
ncbi:zinc/manganese transport system substrate-binding protein [Actinomadura coerulea]|uniref:Zinc/manganese transport system substrate-binding protein n=1 Tax=Actinomadura coerulea TaxID=46159 RepID=A0A7X0FYG8_9ACTN|nr:zinc ABC transporter substrate-binding protein [Actinomadura coerulea]MBB6395864.1 zinc/manganese transport system substrate-binding protein [Actinomadura coerulea]GGQ46882.1 metal ABC transporter substrate-binding protein [Actinomadura coerulea]